MLSQVNIAAGTDMESVGATQFVAFDSFRGFSSGEKKDFNSRQYIKLIMSKYGSTNFGRIGTVLRVTSWSSCLGYLLEGLESANQWP